MKILWDITEFLRKLRKQMHRGDLSRAPLQLLRFEVCGSEAACEWTARAPDPWDADLPSGVRNHNEAFQALRDAIQVRELLLRTLPEVNSVLFRVYRHASREPVELIITGLVSRDDQPPAGVQSLVMQAKLFGLHFLLEDGSLKSLQTREHNLELAT